MGASELHHPEEDMHGPKLSSRTMLRARSAIATRRTPEAGGQQAGEYLDDLVGTGVSVQVLSPGLVAGTLLGWDEHAVFVQVQNGRTRMIPWNAVMWIEGTDLAWRRDTRAFFETSSDRPLTTLDSDLSGTIHLD